MTDKQGWKEQIGTIAAQAILPPLVDLLWPKMEEFLEKTVLPKVLAVIPPAIATAVKAGVEEVGHEVAKPVEAVAGNVLDEVKRITGIDIPDIFGGLL